MLLWCVVAGNNFSDDFDYDELNRISGRLFTGLSYYCIVPLALGSVQSSVYRVIDTTQAGLVWSAVWSIAVIRQTWLLIVSMVL